MIEVSNSDFIAALFKDDAPFCHVTDFIYDPSNIPQDEILRSWFGDYYSRYVFTPGSNQYFTVSTFNPDDTGRARRRKNLFLRTRVVVLDDVEEKLSRVEAEKLPTPSWILETSPGSEQWGYILTEPEYESSRIDNLMDGLIESDLAPKSTDPGMKGTTRYVRLPEGSNNKANKLVNGQPFKCNLKSWNPSHTVTLEQLASPFSIDLDVARRDARTDGAERILDHPVINNPVIQIKQELSAGRYDIVCPWVDEHTDAADNGSAIFTNSDGSIGFQCHHGACEGRTSNDVVKLIERVQPGFSFDLKTWQNARVFNAVPVVAPSFMGSPQTSPQSSQQTAPDPVPATPAPSPPIATIQDLISNMEAVGFTQPEATTLAEKVLYSAKDMSVIEKKSVYASVRSHMHWSQQDFKEILKDLQANWFKVEGATVTPDYMKHFIFLGVQDRFYHSKQREFYTAAGFQHMHQCIDPDAMTNALAEGGCQKAARLDFDPGKPHLFTDKHGSVIANMWDKGHLTHGTKCTEADVAQWLNHWDAMGWSEHRDHHIKWMAYTLQYPGEKINHMLLMGGAQGIGKDFILTPVSTALGDYSDTISADVILSDYDDHLLGVKHLHVNEVELGNSAKAAEMAVKLKPLTADPPFTLSINPKGATRMKTKNIVNLTASTNKRTSLRLDDESRRIFATWSNLDIKDEFGMRKPEWDTYWDKAWEWMKTGGAEMCIYYLTHIVDVSDFRAKSPPPVTEYLQEMHESSKSDLHCEIQDLIIHRARCCKSDLVTAQEVVLAMAADRAVGKVDGSSRGTPTPSKETVGKVMRGIRGVVCIRARRGDIDLRVYAVRSTHMYTGMSAREVLDEYEAQVATRSSGVDFNAYGRTKA